ncbi:MAG TPA: hypothetical protein VIH57_14625 [Bacteroidales bacterium]
MTESEIIVNSLEVKINRLMSLHVELKKDNQRLLSENEELQNALRAKDNEFRDLHSKYENLKLAKHLVAGGEDSHEAKLKVNRIVREIDKCIALLNK